MAAWGFWGDILNSPYVNFGVTCEDKSMLAVSNKQFSRHAVDVGEHNLAVSQQATAALCKCLQRERVLLWCG